METAYRKAKGVFLVVCDNHCANCHLNQLPEHQMQSGTICEFMKADESVIMIRHRTDLNSILNSDEVRQANRDAHKQDFPEDARARTFDGGI